MPQGQEKQLHVHRGPIENRILSIQTLGQFGGLEK